VAAYPGRQVNFVISVIPVPKTPRLVEEPQTARWTGAPRADADVQCRFRYRLEGREQGYRFIALRYFKRPKAAEPGQPEQYQLLDTPGYSYRVFVADMDAAIVALLGFYRQRGFPENLIKEANYDAGLTANPSGC
jgi:hypothetical protein